MTRKRPNYIDNERHARHMSRTARGFMPNISGDRHAIYERFYMKKLMELAVARFEWRGLPKSFDPRFIEMTLLQSGLVVAFRDPDSEHLYALRGAGNGHFNPTDNPTSFEVTGNNYPARRLRAMDCVPIWANTSRTPDMDMVYIYAYRLAQLDATLDINSDNARRTRVAYASSDERLTVANMNREIDAGNPTIYVDSSDGIKPPTITTVDLGVEPKSIEVLHVYKVRLWNEAMMLLGVKGANQDKKERLVADEVKANDEQISLNRKAALDSRRLAAEQLNAKFDTQISVDFATLSAETSPLEGV